MAAALWRVQSWWLIFLRIMRWSTRNMFSVLSLTLNYLTPSLSNDDRETSIIKGRAETATILLILYVKLPRSSSIFFL